MSSSISRRNMLKSAGALAAGAALPKWFLEEQLDADEVKPPTSANEKPNIALIGCGGQGRGNIKDAARFGNVVALCDVDDRHSAGAAMDHPGAKTYHDFRKVMERDDIHVIVNATPDHWHTIVNLHALRAGKDIYGQKPLTLTIDEGKVLVEAVKKSGCVFQVGSQQRSDANFRLACELVRNGRIGTLQEVNVVVPAGWRKGPFPPQPVPAEFDYNFWEGQAADQPFCTQRTHTTFRFWYDYSGGTVTDWGAHHNDIARWGIGLDGPISVDGQALSEPVPGGYTAIADYAIEYMWANGVKSTCASTRGDQWTGGRVKDSTEPHNGVTFKGADGWIFVTRGKIEASKPELLSEPLAAGALRLYESNDHMANFFDCIRTRKETAATAETGHRSVSVCHLGVLSLRLGRKLNWDPAAEKFVNDADADKWLSREMRKPWSLDA
jgi:predicted dehydrogenase